MKKIIGIMIGFLVFSLCSLGMSAKAFDKEKNLCLYAMSSNNKKFCAWRKDVIENISKYYKVIVISNGELNDTCDYADKIIVRPNEGYDFGAWKEYIVGHYDYIKQFDNLLIANDSFYKVSSMDRAIEKGLNSKADLYGLKYDGNGVHLGSYFINMKKRLVNSECFINYCRDMPQINTHGDAVVHGERPMTNYFKRRGYSCDEFRENPMYVDVFVQAKILTDGWDFPIVKRKAVNCMI